MCVIFNEIMKRQSDGQLFIAQKAFCFMFSNNYFPCHIEIMNGLLYSLKCERFKLSEKQYEPGPEQLRKEIEASLNVPVRLEYYVMVLVGN